LLWSGIVNEDKVDSAVKNIMNESMFSGYGLRTLSTNEKGYSPIGYHTGCVWPHDNSIVAFGLSKYGRNKEANKIIDSMLGATPHFGYTLPETFAGFPKLEKGFPVRYPTSSSPQAWAAGASLLFFRTLMGISPSVEKKNIRVKPIFQDKDTFIDLHGIEAFGKKFNISIQDGSSLDVYETHES
jgi:glycogen debranching enzyme